MTANATQRSTNGRYVVASSENATLTTAISECINAIDVENVPMHNIHFSVTWDATNNKYAVVAFGGKH